MGTTPSESQVLDSKSLAKSLKGPKTHFSTWKWGFEIDGSEDPI